MAKYRLLTDEELNEMEKEFVEFLILNGTVASEWVKLKETDPEKTNTIIHLFSDVVFEKIMRTTQFLEWKGIHELKSLQCLKDKFVVMGLNASKIHDADLSNDEYVSKAMKNPPSKLEVFTTEIPYERPREEEIFKLTELGYQISDGKLFKTLCLVLPR